MDKRDFLGFLAAGAVSAPGWAQARELPAAGAVPAASAPTAATAVAQPQTASSSLDALPIAINEGITYRDPSGSAGDRFGELSADLEKLLKRPVRFELVRNYPELVDGLQQGRYGLAYVHPAHHAMHAIKKSQYRLVALTRGYTEYRASFMVLADAPLQKLADLGHERRKVGSPAEDSITSVMARAALREALGTALPAMSYVRYQDAVPFMVENKLCAAGVSASKSVVQGWQDKGGRVLFTSRPVPIKQLLASGRLPAEQRAALTSYFVGLEQQEAGRRRLKALNVPGFVEADEDALVPIGKWLGV